jgi:hypothetical protein
MADDRLPVARPRRRVPLRRYLVPVAVGFVGTIAVVSTVLAGLAAGAGEDDTATLVAPVPAAVNATCQRGPSRDSQGTPTSYEPQRAVDGDPTTAWRCDGDGSQQSITLGFGGPARVAEIGIVPGLAKTDPGDGTDRYAQNRRIARVRITTDAGSSVEAELDTAATNRAVQNVELGGPTARSVTITILSSVPGSPQNGHDAIDSVAIAEIAVR